MNPDDFTREIMWISDHLDLDGRHFFRECCRTEAGLWYVWVYFLGPPHEAEDYATTIKIRQQDDVSVAFQLTMPARFLPRYHENNVSV